MNSVFFLVAIIFKKTETNLIVKGRNKAANIKWLAAFKKKQYYGAGVGGGGVSSSPSSPRFAIRLL